MQRFSGLRDGLAGTGAGGVGDLGEQFGRHAEFAGNGGEPSGCALFAERKHGLNMPGTAFDQGGVSVTQKRLDEGEHCVRANASFRINPVRRQAADRADAHRGEHAQHLILDHVGQRTDHEQLTGIGFGQHGHHAGQRCILALGERRLDTRAGVIQHPDAGGVKGRKPFSGTGQIDLDHF